MVFSLSQCRDVFRMARSRELPAFRLFLETMMKSKVAVSFATLVAILVPFASEAHHSFAMFDRSRKMVVQGVVSRFAWTNPHVFITIVVPSKKGHTVSYVIEGGSISILSRNGWKAGSVKVGDPIRIAFYPLKSGEPGGLLDQVQLKNGTILKQ